MKHMASAKKRPNLNGSSTKKQAKSASQFVVCVKNEDYPASLELRKLYAAIRDREAGKAGFVRVVDESGEDYLYPADYFVAVKLSRDVKRAVQLAS